MKNELLVFIDYFGLLVDDQKGSRVYGFENHSEHRGLRQIEIPENLGGVFGYVADGTIQVSDNGLVSEITQGRWFSTRKGATINFVSEKYRISVWQKADYYGSNANGLVEDYGRLNYIDGCKDSILFSPISKGEPCLNALYMPEKVHQTMHTHPSTRTGFIIVGGARAITENKDINLETGMIFYLPTDLKHKFRSDLGENVMMKLVAYHPDSDFGPTHEEHPMINRTIVDGISANKIDNIRTK